MITPQSDPNLAAINTATPPPDPSSASEAALLPEELPNDLLRDLSTAKALVHQLHTLGHAPQAIAALLGIGTQLAPKHPSLPAIDFRIWGKSRGLPRPYPLLGHLIDTAEAVGVIWDTYLTPNQRAIISAGMKTSNTHARSLTRFWAGLHDVGKAVPGFQSQGPSTHVCFLTEPAYRGTSEAKIQHERASHLTLSSLLADLGYPTSERSVSSVAQQVAQILGGHHGRFGAPLSGGEILNPLAAEPRLGAHGWHDQRKHIVRTMHDLTGNPPPVQHKLPAQAVVLVTAVIVLADWLVSQEDALLRMLPSGDRLAQENGLRNHAALAAAQAPILLRDAQLLPAEFKERDFAAQFPQISLPNDLQQSLINELPQLITGPGLLLITAPTGDGKTEAALYAARALGQATGTSGLFIALPTMATSDQMYQRVRKYAEQNLNDDAALTLLHSMSWLSEDYADHQNLEQQVLTGEFDGKKARADAGTWLRGSRRGLLAPLAVGTVDQALLAALPSKYNALRLLGLSGKTVVVDEAHAYDPYMHGLLLRLLTWLGALKVPVVLMSATLTGTVAGSLVRAYRTGCGHRSSVPIEPTYPGWLFVNAASGEVSEPRSVASNRPRDLTVTVHNVRHDLDCNAEDSRTATLLRELQPLLSSNQGCVAVICTTVAEAQTTYAFLKEEFGKSSRPPQLKLLHARFPADQREAITKEIEGLVGKDNHQRTPTVVVATQVIEQSLDLDFDLVISDLAPLAMLLQRAGRCWRHERERPEWSTQPQLTVLVPVNAEDKVVRPDTWGDVYHESLLFRTADLINSMNGDPIQVPGDIQELVDAVYAPEFPTTDRNRLNAADGLRFADEQAQRMLSELAAIPAPAKCTDLHRLSKHEVDDELIRTRLGADSVRILCCYVDESGDRFLEPECLTPLPEPTKGRRFSKTKAGLILKKTVPVRGSLLRSRGQANQPPESWAEDHRVSEVVLLPFSVVGGVVQSAAVGKWRFRLDGELGLVHWS